MHFNSGFTPHSSYARYHGIVEWSSYKTSNSLALFYILSLSLSNLCLLLMCVSVIFRFQGRQVCCHHYRRGGVHLRGDAALLLLHSLLLLRKEEESEQRRRSAQPGHRWEGPAPGYWHLISDNGDIRTSAATVGSADKLLQPRPVSHPAARAGPVSSAAAGETSSSEGYWGLVILPLSSPGALTSPDAALLWPAASLPWSPSPDVRPRLPSSDDVRRPRIPSDDVRRPGPWLCRPEHRARIRGEAASLQSQHAVAKRGEILHWKSLPNCDMQRNIYPVSSDEFPPLLWY